MESPSLRQATRVFIEDVDRLAMARYYLSCELPNIIPARNPTVETAFTEALLTLSDQEIWRLLEALSFTYRMNAVFEFITNTAVDWMELELPISAITLTGTKPHIDDIVYSRAIHKDPIKFAHYLNQYFEQHPDPLDDPLRLNDFRETATDLRHPIVFTREYGPRIGMLDGTHRLLALARAGATSIRAYSAIRTDKPVRYMVGDSTFLVLVRLFKRFRTDSDRKQIAAVAAMLAKTATNGESAVRNYWIVHPRTESVRRAGQAILDSMKRK